MGSSRLKAELYSRAQAVEGLRDFTLGNVPSVIFGQTACGRHGNFHPTSYRQILANPSWAKRLAKVHTASRRAMPRADWRWRELDSANSSDALLMNIFCHPHVMKNRQLCSALGIDDGTAAEFGFRPKIVTTKPPKDRTEIDLKLGGLLIEAKLTESDFQLATMAKIQRYRDFHDVFEAGMLGEVGGAVRGYQVIRGILAAHNSGGSFCLFCDARRPDLIESWFSTLRAVKLCDLRARLKLMTWQELSFFLPKSLQKFLHDKYGICSA